MANKFAVIDVGSNSVRLMVNNNGQTVYKLIEVTRLAEKMAHHRLLNEEAMKRTLNAVVKYVKHSLIVERVTPMIFATEAVRASDNGLEFQNMVKEKTGIDIEVLGGNVEAQIAYLGCASVYKDGINAIIDIGGGSTEIIVGNGNNILYSKSLPIGAVRIKNCFGEDRIKIENFVRNEVEKFGEIPKWDRLIGVAGTITSLGFLTLGIEEYDSKFVHNTALSYDKVVELENALYNMSVEDRIKKGLHDRRVDIICGGTTILRLIMEMLKANKLVVSESDNMEGYCIYKKNISLLQ